MSSTSPPGQNRFPFSSRPSPSQADRLVDKLWQDVFKKNADKVFQFFLKSGEEVQCSPAPGPEPAVHRNLQTNGGNVLQQEVRPGGGGQGLLPLRQQDSEHREHEGDTAGACGQVSGRTAAKWVPFKGPRSL